MLIRAVVAADPALQERLRRPLADEDLVVREAAGEDFSDVMENDACDIAFLASSVLGGSLRESIIRLREAAPCCEVVVLQPREDAEERAVLLGAGCFGVVSAELSDRGLGRALSAFLRRRRETLNAQLDPSPQGAEVLLVPEPRSEAMRECLARAEAAAGAQSPVLILGETGAGKEWLARRVHARSRRALGPFVAVNCAALPESLWESEMFGHERGAFTGADQGRRGPFELAHGGTLFLDEIGDIPLHQQPKLLRVLEERVVQRLGSERPVAVDVRVMAATNRDLEAAVEVGSFRADLYFRLAVVTLEVPPLRQRQEDIAGLSESLLARLRREFRPHVERLRPEVLDAFAAYPWPGNVRELANAIETGMLLSEGSEIGLGALPLRVRATLGRAASRGRDDRGYEAPAASAAPLTAPRRGWTRQTLADVVQQVVRETERDYLHRLLEETGGSLAQVAQRADIAPRSLYNKMRRHGLRKEAYRTPSTPTRAGSASSR